MRCAKDNEMCKKTTRCAKKTIRCTKKKKKKKNMYTCNVSNIFQTADELNSDYFDSLSVQKAHSQKRWVNTGTS